MSDLSAFTPRFLSAPEYVLALHEPNDYVAVLVRNRSRVQSMQRILPAETIASPPIHAWLKEQNEAGADIYVAWNRTGVCSFIPLLHEPLFIEIPEHNSHPCVIQKSRRTSGGRSRTHNQPPGSTIATQLFNAKQPLSLFELQAWLGHSSPHSSQHYARINPTKLARSYTDAAYLQRNLRTIEVLIDQEVVRSGTADSEPWRFYDLGTAIARMTSSISAHTAWLALVVGSTVRRIARQHSFLRARKTCFAFSKTSL